MRSPEADLTVAARSLGKRYGGRWVMRGVTFHLSPGTLLGLVGANGCGKTTTLRLLAGLLRPDEGSLSVFGNDIERPSTASRRQIGYMSQRLSLYPELSVAENLAFRAAIVGVPGEASRDRGDDRTLRPWPHSLRSCRPAFRRMGAPDPVRRGDDQSPEIAPPRRTHRRARHRDAAGYLAMVGRARR